MRSLSPGLARRDKLKMAMPDTPYLRNKSSPRSRAISTPAPAPPTSATSQRTRMLSRRLTSFSRTASGPNTGRCGSNSTRAPASVCAGKMPCAPCPPQATHTAAARSKAPSAILSVNGPPGVRGSSTLLTWEFTRTSTPKRSSSKRSASNTALALLAYG